MSNLKRGPKGKLNPELQNRICEQLRSGISFKATAALCHIGAETLHGWLRIGKSEKGTRLAEFYNRVIEARAICEAICIRTIRNAIVGGWFDAPVYDRDGNPIPLVDPESGEVIRDEKGRPKMAMRSEFREPNVAVAKWFLQRMNPREFGPVDQEQLLPDPQAELDKAPTQVMQNEPEHKRISASLLARAVAFLGAQGVEIPGMVRAPKPDEGKIVNAEVVNETKLVEAKPREEKPGEEKFLGLAGPRGNL